MHALQRRLALCNRDATATAKVAARNVNGNRNGRYAERQPQQSLRGADQTRPDQTSAAEPTATPKGAN
jgi:hypothetical protein